jgi:Patatin-like phospholipase
LILREIMEGIGSDIGAETAPRPCEYFDLIGGSGTGGLIAIMLGLLGMVLCLERVLIDCLTVEECVDTYLKLAKEVFNVDQILNGTIPVGDTQCRFDYKILEQHVKDMIRDRKGSDHYKMSEAANSPPYCPTFVIATTVVQVDGPPTVFRSYAGQNVRPSVCTVWQAARVATATPSFFKEMYIDNPRPGIKYIDGGLGHNNPAEMDRGWTIMDHSEIILSSQHWNRSQKAVTLDRIDQPDEQWSLFDKMKEFIPHPVSIIPEWKTATELPTGVRSVINMAHALSKLAFNTEDVNRRLQRASSTDPTKRFPYYRFNPDRDLGDIGFGDWKEEKWHYIAAYTRQYLDEHEGETKLSDCIRALIRNNQVPR